MREYVGEMLGVFAEYEPEAAAEIKGSKKYPRLRAKALFYPFWKGTLVYVQAAGLPEGEEPCGADIFALHIHEGSACTGTAEEPFKNAGGHYNPSGCAHPEHPGDLPPLFAGKGAALQVFYTDRFRPEEIKGRTMVIHGRRDDFTTQPSGDPGEMIACGVIR